MQASGCGGKALWLTVLGVGCFGLLVVGGIIAAIVIPNFTSALQKAKVKRTIGDLRTIAVAIESYGADHGSFPVASSYAELLPILGATTTPLPTLDGWKREFRYQCVPSEDLADPCAAYGVWSSGSDGIFECDDVRCYESGAIEPGRDDLVLRDGQLLRRPRSGP